MLTTLTVRSVFIIDPNKKLRPDLHLPLPASLRNFDEILPVIDSSNLLIITAQLP